MYEIELKPTDREVYETETEHGLRYAVLYDERFVIALFDDLYWATHFVDSAGIGKFSIREVSEG
jgi:hypothetical protein